MILAGRKIFRSEDKDSKRVVNFAEAQTAYFVMFE